MLKKCRKSCKVCGGEFLKNPHMTSDAFGLFSATYPKKISSDLGWLTKPDRFWQNIPLMYLPTLESGINVPPWINIAPGTFGKNNRHSPLNKCSPLKFANLCGKIKVFF